MSEDSVLSEEAKTWRDTFSGTLNVEEGMAQRQIRINTKRPLPQVKPYPPSDYEVALLCGGPSLEEAVIPEHCKIAVVNNTYQWALEHDLTPSVYMQLDAREFNARFVENPIKSCKYVLCSQVHPSIFDKLEGYNVHIWHSAGGKTKRWLNRYYNQRWAQIPGGSTIGTRAIWLLYMLGIRKIRVFGMDCCYREMQHHAYEQAENDKDLSTILVVGEGERIRPFRVAPWMVAQLDEFFQLAPNFPDDLDLEFEGDGLLTHVLSETAALGEIPKINVGDN
jgi:hypothetical protein